MPQLVGGYDVLSMQGLYPTGEPLNKVVADDWLCNDPRPVTDIHIWGSWWNDQPAPDWTPVFQLTIYSDIPAVPGVTYSTPGEALWSTIQVPTVRFWDLGQELFYDPNTGLLSPETVVWQYNFVLDPADYFRQQEGTIYWLSVQALGPTQGHLWGWKTSEQHWNDDATFTDPDIPTMDWQELRDPFTGSPTFGQSLDMAFVLTVPEPRVYALAVGLALTGFAAWRRRRRA